MIEVPVSQQDRCWPRVATKPLLGRGDDSPHPWCNARVNKDPATIFSPWLAHEVSVYQQHIDALY
jgi:hypothetical protein